MSTPAHAAEVDPEAYDWEEIHKVGLSSLASSGVDLNALLTPEPAPEAPLVFGGARGAAARAAIKTAIKALRGIGKKAWDAMVAKLPLPSAVKKYLGYELTMKVLNIALDFEGEVTENIKNALKSVGVPNWAAGIAARAIVTFLL